MLSDQIDITKASGKVETFSDEKLRQSLINSGASAEVAESIALELQPTLYPGIPTKKIYRFAHNMLRKRSAPMAAKYHLKKGIMELGPSGYPFERFVGELLKNQGYFVRLGEIVRGNCVNHEIDVIAEKDHHHFMIECKYHNHQGIICNVKIPLYMQARFKDVEAEWLKIPGHGAKFHQGWVVTNTRFSSDAIQYGTCAGLNLLGWDYPLKKSLKDQIDKLGLYPVTCLTTLTKFEKIRLVEKNIILCKDVCNNPSYLTQIGINELRMENILSECYQLCNKLPIPKP